MPLSNEERQAVLESARDLILKQFHVEFQDLYAYAVAVVEIAPEQANNEIRKSLSLNSFFDFNPITVFTTAKIKVINTM